MAQQTEAEWTDAQNATELNAGDDVRVVDQFNGSAVIDTATVRDTLEGVGTVNLTLATGRTKEVRFQDDGSVKVRGDCFTYTLQVRREVDTDGGQEDEQEADEVAVAYTTAHVEGDLKVETGTVLEDSPYQHRTQQDDEVYVQVEREGETVYLRVPLHGGAVYALHHATKRHDVRQGSLHGLVKVDEVGHYVCMNCREFHDSTTPVETGHGTTGRSGCPECLEADPLRSVVHEVGDERTVKNGHVSSQSRGYGSQVSLEAAKAIVDDQ